MPRPAAATSPAPRSAALRAASSETTWVGYKAGVTSNHWSIGTGPARGAVDMRGMWTWDTPVHGDSLQGWWPIRFPHIATSSGSQVIDLDRPWWAIEAGNQANYVINQGRFDAVKLGTAHAGNRTFGVVGLWHSDPGNGAPGTGVNWAPLAGTRSAWMGLRRHGDLTAVDPITGNPFVTDLTAFSSTVSLTATPYSRQFPGYGSQMDQMLYRDISLAGAPADSGVRIAFRFRTQMSTGKVTTASTRTGWYEGDPLTLNTITPDNFISAEAGAPANSLAPIDSFQVYVGAPVEGTWLGSDNVTRPVYDPLRRWFNEVLKKNARYWKFGKAGADSGEVTIVITKVQKDAIVAAAGAPTLRVVFRVHTNRDFDDGSALATYTSNGRGAAQVDDVRYDAGMGPVSIGDFEGGDPAKTIDNLQPASAAWRSTGKPPSIMFHAHDLASLTWEDLCGLPGSATANSDMKGTVIAMGDHDDGETVVGAWGTPDAAGRWGILSPAIGLASSPGVKNAFDLTLEEATGEYAIAYDIYSAIFDIFVTGHSWQWMVQAYPEPQPDGTPGWGPVRTSPFVYFSPTTASFRDVVSTSGLPLPAGGVPDSIRIGILRRSFVPTHLGPYPADLPAGAYLDNVSLGIVHAATPAFSADIWDWFQDTFPFNESPTLPGTSAFDTTSALIRTGLNIAQTTGTMQRYDVPGDSALVSAPGTDVRVDLVFRIVPGVGNHVTVGSPTSGLRRAPTSTTAVSSGDGSWWGTWLAMPGDFATPNAVALHATWPGGWNPNVWMSARCDTAQLNLFPIDARGIGALASGRWMSAYHEDDPHLPILGIARSKCFLVDTAGANNSTNITCSSVPAWLSAGATGHDGSATTVEGTQIFPDGLFTPGTHVQYFWRRSAASAPGAMTAMVPDTTTVVPQPGEDSYDGHRWQGFGVLPDRWKKPQFGGSGDPCMLVIDLADRRGDELAWISAADSVGFSMFMKHGAHNGWHGHSDLSPNDPATFVAAHRGQAGSVFDLYQVKAGETIIKQAGGIGSRLSYRDPSPLNLVHGKYSKQGPTLEMLAAYYGLVVLLTGDLTAGILGPFSDGSQDDKGLLRQFLELATPLRPRGLITFGDGFATSESGDPFLTDVLGAESAGVPYWQWASDPASLVRLTPEASFLPGGYRFGVRNDCPEGPGVLTPYTATVPEAFVGGTLGSSASPATAIVHKPATAERPWLATTHSFAFARLVTDGGLSTRGRFLYLDRLMRNTVYSWMCIFPGDYFSEVPTTPVLADGVRLLNTPLAHGEAVVEFTLAAPDRVTIGLYDIGGRLVRTLAERAFEAGPQRLAWDGADDSGHRLSAGVYFARVRYAARGFEKTKKVVILK